MDSTHATAFPPHCPNQLCRAHSEPFPGFSKKMGTYRPKHRARPVQRYRCTRCRRSFSRQTFRVDYCDNKHWLNAQVFGLLSSGVGYRQIARQVGMSPRNVEMKARKLMRHLSLLHRALMGTFGPSRTFAFDELETFEGCRSTRPVTVPILIDQETTFIVDACSEIIPPSGKMTRRRKRLIAEEEQRSGKRRNQSRIACQRVLQTLSDHLDPSAAPRFRSDRKASYPGLIRGLFGHGTPHTRIHSKRRRDPTNPLHRINLTLARARDLMGRLRRRSWLVTKKREFLDLQLMAFACYRNYTQTRFNTDDVSPAEMLGFLPRRLKPHELLSWRQDLGLVGIHPLATLR